MTVTNNALMCHRYHKEEDNLNECVGVLHTYITNSEAKVPNVCIVKR